MIKQRDWIKLPPEIRAELIVKYGLTRSSFTDVRGGEVFSDGFTDNDLEKVEDLIVSNTTTTNGGEQNGETTVSGDGSKKDKKTNKGKALPISDKQHGKHK